MNLKPSALTSLCLLLHRHYLQYFIFQIRNEHIDDLELLKSNVHRFILKDDVWTLYSLCQIAGSYRIADSEKPLRSMEMTERKKSSSNQEMKKWRHFGWSSCTAKCLNFIFRTTRFFFLAFISHLMTKEISSPLLLHISTPFYTNFAYLCYMWPDTAIPRNYTPPVAGPILLPRIQINPTPSTAQLTNTWFSP